MRNLFFFLRLIRTKNLTLLAALLAAIYLRFYAEYLTWHEAFLIIFSNLLTAAYGNAVNDFFDQANDAANGLKKHDFDSEKFSKLMRRFFTSITILSITPVFYLYTYFPQFFFVCIMSVIFLHIYSDRRILHLKSVPFLGNFVIAFLSGTSLMSFSICTNFFPNEVLFWGLLSFLLTFSRELSKDFEDEKGDSATGVRTVATVYGALTGKTAMLICQAGLCLLIYGAKEASFFSFQYSLLLYCTSAAMTVFILKAQEKKDWTRLSFLHKIIMLGGLMGVMS